ncbi:fructosamine kinase family protein [Alkalilimnicola ehrlichii MLHE-1]|uniref:Fructosamine kinase n=1 Tax=Alkalilimnicola ehrlichii (strain ATCC BAA-1101 / DSM 17681 / MLHE-1) TaxID=187272 RepID=Q0A556_ALKEH|nr:fructosamine kinase family protein [Alkalilimnicola ehrlichii]ABI58031.1 fructosamine kinase [Alkalilimnicola ehrlichii MLHE-1]
MTDARPDPIREAIARVLGVPAAELRLQGVGGGCVSDTARVHAGGRTAFLKREPASRGWQLAAEAEGLEALAAAGALRVPRPLSQDEADGQAWLLMEYLEIERAGDWAAMGRALAATHAATADRHGWHRDNALGGTPQDNTREADWALFFRDRRLRPQLALAAANGHDGPWLERGARLAERLPSLLDHAPAPSLLHGDFWGGNAGFCAGRPATWDPAVHYGDRECDLAMAALFGGFGPAFRHAYQAEWPLPPGHELRQELYQLYHILNHLNLFGAAYLGSARRLIDRLLAAGNG